MDNAEVLSRSESFPTRVARPGEIIIEQDGDPSELLILRSGTVEVRRDAQLVAVIDEAGATLGEVSMLLASPSTAAAMARHRSTSSPSHSPLSSGLENPGSPWLTPH